MQKSHRLSIKTQHWLSEAMWQFSLKSLPKSFGLMFKRRIWWKGTAGRTSGALFLPRPPGLYGPQLEQSWPVRQRDIDLRAAELGCYPLDPVVLLSPISLSYPRALSLPRHWVQPVLITISLWHPLPAIWQLNRQNGALPCSLWKQQEDLGPRDKTLCSKCSVRTNSAMSGGIKGFNNVYILCGSF